ncbi:fasciclin domain-containing protein [Flammeovirga aprica]|uniref:Fasciclin domain-containing protein n=1 Tax=Flammeovirga aprica JL-4 TaxID=694437 RepID=A0A7X9XD74_9BACT|nr:fasciclin domain-containing protein [Flammeovirga aprica]NME72493.1 fasciclin domain-containing protein [Flammeovirga aprica JL-4]
MKTLDLLKVVFVLSILFTSCTDDNSDDPVNLPANTTTTIAGIAQSTPDFSTLTSALSSANLVDAFNDTDIEYTVFAPTNAAFSQLLAEPNGISSFDDISSGALDILLKNHAVAAKLLASDLEDGQFLTTLAGTQLEVKITNGVVTVGGVTVTTPNVEASNGVIHIVDQVIVPTQSLTIAQLAIGTPDFSTLVTALSQANLVTPFTQVTNQYTVFAPTNKAFEDAGVNLDEISEAQLQRILLHHVASNKVLSSSLQNGQMVETLAETELMVKIEGSSVMIGDATVVQADVNAFNGVVHAIDKVLIPAEELETILSIASSDDFTSLATALTTANLADMFGKTDKMYTVFAPDNMAFTSLLAATNGISSFDDLSMEALEILLGHHVVEGKVMAMDLKDGQMVNTLAGTKLEVKIMGTDVMIGGVKVKQADVEANNGVVHIVEDVIVPTEALTIAQIAISNNFTSLVDALAKAELVSPFTDASNEFTVFAPTNEAFTAAGINLDEVSKEDLDRILKHHVISNKVLSDALQNGQKVETLAGTRLDVMIENGNVMIGESMVALPNLSGVNGVVHVIDKVLMPSTIVDVATTQGVFTSLLGALDNTDLLSTFNVDYKDGVLKEYTVFAPTDEAFAAISDVTLTNEQLAAILANHVVSNKVLSTDLQDGQVVETLGEGTLTVSINNGVVTVGGATVSKANVGASNGVIHVINKVITD